MVLQMMKINCDTAQEYYLQQAIKDKMQGFSFSHPKCSATVLLQLAVDLQHLKEEFYNVGKHHLTRNKALEHCLFLLLSIHVGITLSDCLSVCLFKFVSSP